MDSGGRSHKAEERGSTRRKTRPQGTSKGVIVLELVFMPSRISAEDFEMSAPHFLLLRGCSEGLPHPHLSSNFLG